jgi:hypothetical protein
VLFAPVYINEINYTTQQVLLLRNANTKTKDIPVLAVQTKYNFFADVYAGMVHVFIHFRFQAKALFATVTFCISMTKRGVVQKISIYRKKLLRQQ